jgi:CubicO group peptidase (beta-lactamase class C family)
MPKPSIRNLILAFALVAACPALLAADPPDVRDLKDILDPIRRKAEAPAVAAAVYRDGHLIAMGVCGVRSLESKTPVTPKDIFPIGSCSKPMARLVFARLMEHGALKPDATLADLLKDVTMREEYRDVTLADLMAHRAGIQPYTRIGPQMTPILFELIGPARQQRAQFTAHVLDEKPAAKPKSRFLYSNAGFCILGTVAENAADRDWEDLIAAEVFEPLNLKSATEGGKGVKLAGHFNEGGEVRVAPRRDKLAALAPAGGVALTIADFAAFASAEADVEAGRPVMGLSAETLKKVPDLRPADMGPISRGGTMLFGGDGLYTAAFATWPKQRVGIAVATNLGGGDDVCVKLAAAVREAVTPDIEPGDTAGSSTGQRTIRIGGP